MIFEILLQQAQEGKAEAITEICDMYKPLLIKNAIVDGTFDEDLYQELVEELLKCIRHFREMQ